MQVSKWGPGLWTTLHCMTFNYSLKPTKEDRHKYLIFFTVLGQMLPCKYCRDSYNIYIKHIPIRPYLDSREGVTLWLHTIHNLINNKLFKDGVYFKDTVIKYEKMRASCGKVKKTCKRGREDGLDMKEIDRFVNKAINRYGGITKGFIEKLYNSPDNPNKKAREVRAKKLARRGD